MTFDPAFRLYQDEPRAWRWTSLVAVFQEVDAELALRRQHYPNLVAKGRLAEAEAAHELRVWSRIRDGARVDVRQPDADRSYTFGDGETRPPATGAEASWTEIVGCLRREIDQRRARYPALVAKGHLDAATAARRLRLIEHLHHAWWEGHACDEATAAHAAAEAHRLAA